MLDVDTSGEVYISTGYQPNLFFKIAGKIDMIIEDPDGNEYVWDNKTTSLEEERFIEFAKKVMKNG